MPLVGSIPSSLSDTVVVVLFFFSNALLFVHDLSRPHPHACYPDSAYIRAIHAAYVTHYLTIILPNPFLRFTPSHIPRPL